MWECKACGMKFETEDETLIKFCPSCGEEQTPSPCGAVADECAFAPADPNGSEDAASSVEETPQPPLAGPWRRWAARLLDYWLINSIIGFLVGCLLALMGYAQIFSEPGWEIALGIFVALLTFITESLVYAIFGNTLGKWLFGARPVHEFNGEKLSSATYFVRNIYIFAFAFGLGIPFINCALFAYQYGRLSRGQAASYDEKLQIISTKHCANALKTTLGVMILLIVMIGLVFLTRISYEPQPQISSQLLSE